MTKVNNVIYHNGVNLMVGSNLHGNDFQPTISPLKSAATLNLMFGNLGGDRYVLPVSPATANIILDIPDFSLGTDIFGLDTLDLSNVLTDVHVVIQPGLRSAVSAVLEEIRGSNESLSNSNPWTPSQFPDIFNTKDVLITVYTVVGGVEYPIPIAAAYGIENIIGGKGETMISIVDKAELKGTIAPGLLGSITLDYSSYYPAGEDPTPGVTVELGAGLDLTLVPNIPTSGIPLPFVSDTLSLEDIPATVISYGLRAGRARRSRTRIVTTDSESSC